MHNAKRTIALLLALCMIFSLLPVSALAINISTKPENGTTTGQPFAAGTGGSANFRIPGIVTLNDGTLIAACDARWNHAGDGAGLDTIVSVSTDNGENWTYTYANYLGDNGNTYNNLSTCFIDPGIGTDGTTAYLIADLWPAGIALNTSKYSPVAGENGFDDNDNLLLRDVSKDTVAIGGYGYNTMAANADYDYYLDLETLTLHKEDGTAVEGYTVDAYFNIVSDDGSVNTNLFFSDSPYQPYPTDYLYMTTSTDGLNWSEPQLLNLKEENEQTLLIGPGNGTYDAANDRMIFTGYEHSSGYERASLIWMDAEGNWYRSEDATVNSWSSEATSVVLDDGTVRCFYRDGYTSLRYTDYVFDESINNYVRADYEVNTAATVDSGCQLTSIKYSKELNGKDVILVAGPTSYRRINGYIYAFLVDEDNSMELAYAYNVTPDFYAYSCLTELADGRIGLLYESAGSSLKFVTYDFEEIANRENDPRLNFKKFELLTGDSISFTDNSGYYGDADISELDTAVAELVMTGEEIVTDAAQLGSNTNYSDDIINLADCLYTFTKGEDDRWSAVAMDGTVHLYPGNTTSSGYPNRDTEYANLSVFEGHEEGSFCIMSNDCDNGNQPTSYLYFDRGSLRWDRVSSPGTNSLWLTNTSMYLYRQVEGAGSAEIPGYERITSIEELTDGEYLVAAPGNDGNWYALYPSTSTANRYCQIAKLLGRTTVGHTELTFTGMSAGYTEVQVGSTVYQITVADVSDVIVDIPVGTSVTVTEANGNYANADTSSLNTGIATVTLKGIDGTAANGLSLEPVSELADGTYVIRNTRANKLVTNAPASAAAAAGAGSGLNMNGTVNDDVADIAVWTIKKVDGGYTIQDKDGNYMTIGSKTASMVADPVVLTLNWRGSTWTISKDGAYLNHFGGASSTCAAGWQDGSAAGDEGSQFALYTYSAEPQSASTEITFTGVYPGSTDVLIGRTHYFLNVTGEAHKAQLNVGETASFVIGGDQTGADVSALNGNVATVEMALTEVALPGTGEGYDANFLELTDCLYTFTAVEGGYFEVSAVTADGETVYLNHYSTAVSQIPNCATPGKIEVRSSSHENMFKLVAESLDGAASSRGLHFHAEKDFPHWNRCGNDASANCHEYLVRYDAETGSFSLVTDLAQVVDGGQYLIGHKDAKDNMYILVPSTNADNWFAHVGLISYATKITFTAVGAGETSLTLPGAVFEISVNESETTEPTDPVEPTDPTDPVEPTDPTDPVEPTVPVDPPVIEADDDSWDIPLADLEVSCGDYELNGGASEGPANLAVDGNNATMWHTDWYGTSRENHWFQFEVNGDYTVCGLRYLPRQTGNYNGTITKYQILISEDGENFTPVAEGNWAPDTTWKISQFAGVKTKYVRLLAVDAVTDNDYVFASAAEIRLTYLPTETSDADKTALNALIAECELIEEGNYTAKTWQKFQKALEKAQTVAANPYASQAQVDEALEALELAKAGLKEKVEGEGIEKIFHLDSGRKYFSKDWTIALLNELSAAGYTHLQLAFGNNGFRFVLDDMTIEANGKTYDSDELKEGIRQGNYNYGALTGYYVDGAEALTEAEMDEIIAHGKAVGVEIIPHLNMPGHMSALLDAMDYIGIEGSHFVGRVESDSSVNLENEAALNFMFALTDKYAAYFAERGVKYFHIGADEYANDAYNGNMGFPSMGAALYQKFADFVNENASIVKKYGMTPRAWNDGLYYGSYTSEFDSDIEINYWSSGWYGYTLAKASTLDAKGHGLINTNGDFYYILGKDDRFTTGSSSTHNPNLYTECAGYDLNYFMDGSTIEEPVGGMFCVWADYPGAETETEVGANVRLVLRAMALRMEGLDLDVMNTDVVPGGFNADGTINGAEAPHEHDWSDWTVTTKPTCTEKGEETRSCECGKTETREVAALGHTEITIPGAPATCTATGLTEGKKCSVCNEILVAQEEIPALGHTEEVIPGTPATCTEDGLTEGKKCAVCGETLVAQEIIPALGHDWKGTECENCDATRENPFVDVPADSFYIDPVLWAVEKGITNGMTATTFGPDLTCNRAQVVTFLWRAAGEPAPTSTEHPFTDVEEGAFYYDAMLWAVEKGITNGLTATTFGPNETCNRAQVVTFLWRAAGEPEATVTEHPFTDVDETQFYYKAMLWAVEKGITNGLTTTTFGPTATCNRAQVVTFLYRNKA